MRVNMHSSYVLFRCITAEPVYQINITVDDTIRDIHFDGIRYTGALPFASLWSVADTVSLPSKPSVIAVHAFNVKGTAGIIASDSAGHVTDSSWKCTSSVYANWTATSFNDSLWPAAVQESINGQFGKPWTALVHGGIEGISADAAWIWSSVVAAYNETYCRYRLP